MLILSLHPTMALYATPYEAGTFVEDVRRWVRAQRGALGPGLDDVKADATGHEFIQLALDAKLRGIPLAVDIETAPAEGAGPWTGKDPTQARLKTIAFGNIERGLSCRWDGCGDYTRQVVRELLVDTSLVKIFHNGPWFDIRVLARYGMPVNNWHDSRDLRRALSSTSKLSLGYLGSLYCDIPNWKQDEAEAAEGDEDEGAEKKFWESADITTLQEYNARDTVVTARIWQAMQGDAGNDERVKKLYETHIGLSNFCSRMHTRGIHVNTEWRNFMQHFLVESVAEKEELLRAAVGQADFPCTDGGMRALIFRRHVKDGIKCFNVPDPFDKKLWTSEFMETISVDESSLLMLMVSGGCPPELFPIINAWWDLQGEKKRLGFVKSRLIDEAIGPDGRLRPGWNSCGTDTGRLSCSQPNVMQMEQLLRHMLAPAPGHALVHADMSQLELRVMAMVASDMVLQDALDTGDVYSFDARNWYGLPADMNVKKLKPNARKSAKIIHLGAQYGAGVKTVFAQALRQDRSFTLQQTKLLCMQFKKLYYRTIRYWGEEMARVLECGFSESRIMHRRRTYPREPELSEVVNYPVQSTSSDMMNIMTLELEKRLADEVPSAAIVIQLHDAVDVECREEDGPQVERIVDEVMVREWTVNGLTRVIPIERKTAYASKNETWFEV